MALIKLAGNNDFYPEYLDHNFAEIASGGGGIGGGDGAVQFGDGKSFGGDVNYFKWDKNLRRLGINLGGEAPAYDIDVNGTIRAKYILGNISGATGVGGTGGVVNEGSTTVGADKSKDGIGKISLQIGEKEQWSVENDGTLRSETGAAIENAGNLTLAAIDKIVDSSANIVKTFIYDTSIDSDGGAWRYRTEHTAWYQEQLNTAIRGRTRRFPAKALIVAETNRITIYDMDLS